MLPVTYLSLRVLCVMLVQVSQHLQALGKQVGIRVVGVVGGMAPVKQERLLRARPQVVVATPGRLWDLITHGQQHLCDLEQLSFFVLDEADRMVQQVGCSRPRHCFCYCHVTCHVTCHTYL